MKDTDIDISKPAPHKKSVSMPAWFGFLCVVVILCAICAVTWCLLYFMSDDVTVAVSETVLRKQYPVIVVDAGHGGIDGGAVGVDGSLEKDLNLDVSKRLAELLRLAGIDCVMTRTEDRMLADESMKSHRKMHDLKNRLSVVKLITEGGRDAVLLSVHMNNFSSPKYSGLQVWYSQCKEESSQLASCVQDYAREWLDTTNNRKIKPATSAIYMLDRATVPAILIECGFLSNPEECSRLATEEYRRDLAVTVFAAVAQWLSAY